MIVLLAVAVHGPLLLMQLPTASYDAWTHLVFAQQYAQHWFNAWNPKWFGGFSQTTYPPLTHQWIALFSHVVGLTWAYMLVQLIAILLLPVGMYRFARLWVDERSAGFAALGTVFLGSLAMLAYQSGQINTTLAAALALNALPYAYRFMRAGSIGSLLKGSLLMIAAACAHHVTAIFGLPLFAIPVFALAFYDHSDGEDPSSAGVISRAVTIAILTIVGIGIALLPYWISVVQNPITQQPIPHGSRDNYLINTFSGLNFWVIPMGALIIAIPFVIWKGWVEARLRPLMLAFYVTLLIGLGGTTPVAHLLLQRYFYILTFERYTFWATLLALPITGYLAAWLVERFRAKAVISLWVLAVLTFSTAVSWMIFHPIGGSEIDVSPIVNFLNRDDHAKFRYLTLGFGNQFSEITTKTVANSIDGDYNSARLLPEMTAYGAGKLDTAKYYGTGGMESLRAILKHANQYGIKYIFVRDRYYEPLLAFAGWRPSETYDDGVITLWTKEDVQPARPIDSGFMPTTFQNIIWGTLPMLSSLLALFLVLVWPERRSLTTTVEFPGRAVPADVEPVVLREAK
jgi:hypothetical protein